MKLGSWIRDIKHEDYFWSFLPKIYINSRIPAQEKVCGLCGEMFIPHESLDRIICYSQKCTKKYDKAKQSLKTEQERKERREAKRIDNEMKIRICSDETKAYIQSKKSGYIYLMSSENGYYKIGITRKQTEERLKGIKRQFPIEIRIIHYIKSMCCRNVETFLHEKYSHKRIENEWFNLSEEDIIWIIALKDYELDGIM